MNAKTLVLCLLGLIGLNGSAFAQSCPPGIAHGTPGCIPPSNPASPLYPHSEPIAPTPMIWADRWGAIATNEKTGHVGTIAGQASKRGAKKIAMQRCGDGCKVRMVYYNQCAAIAWGSGSYSANGAATVQEASVRALRVCGQGADDCKVVFTECSMAERVQ